MEPLTAAAAYRQACLSDNTPSELVVLCPFMRAILDKLALILTGIAAAAAMGLLAWGGKQIFHNSDAWLCVLLLPCYLGMLAETLWTLREPVTTRTDFLRRFIGYTIGVFTTSAFFFLPVADRRRLGSMALVPWIMAESFPTKRRWLRIAIQVLGVTALVYGLWPAVQR